MTDDGLIIIIYCISWTSQGFLTIIGSLNANLNEGSDHYLI